MAVASVVIGSTVGPPAIPPVVADPVDRQAVLRAAVADGYADLWATAARQVGRRRRGLSVAASRAEAEDVVQEAVRRALAKADRYDPARSAVAWVMGFVALVLAESARRAKRDAERPTGPDSAAARDVARLLVADRRVDPSLADEYGPLLGPALARLGDADRRLLTLVRDEDLTGRELADRLGLPSEGAARVARHRAMTAVRGVIRGLLAERGEDLTA